MKKICSLVFLFIISFNFTNADLIGNVKTINLKIKEKNNDLFLFQTNNIFSSNLISSEKDLEMFKKERNITITIDDGFMKKNKTEIDKNYIPKTTEVIDLFVKKIWVENFINLLKNNKIKIFWSENSCKNSKKINQFGYSFLDYQKCFFEKKEKLENNSYQKIKYLINSKKKGTFLFKYYPFYSKENIYLWWWEILNINKQEISTLTFIDSSLEPQNLKIGYWENIILKPTKKYELIIFKKNSKNWFVFLPYYEFELPIKEWENNIFISSKNYISKKYDKFWSEYIDFKEYY